MSAFPPSMRALIESFARMPGVGPRTAQRLAFYLLKASRDEAESLVRAVMKVKDTVRSCSVCNNLSDAEICHICSSPARDRSILCVVEEPNDVVVIERAGGFSGVYHVLLGSLSPLDGIGPQDIKMRELVERAKKERFKEVIIATDFNTEGEATALYIIRALKGIVPNVSRVAYGIPVGSAIEYADQATIVKAFEGRRSSP